LVTTGNRSYYEREIAAMHRARKAVFVDKLGWRLPVRDGMEHDEYDDARAMYILGFDTAQDVTMSIRIRPADDRSMLRDHFAHHLPVGMRPIEDGRTWEVSRGFSLEQSLRRAAMKRKAACMIAPLEIALEAEIDRYVGFTDVRMLSLYYHVGWKLNLLGDAMPYGEGDGVAYEAEVSAQVVRDIRSTWGLPAPATVHFPSMEADLSVHQAAAKIAMERPGCEDMLAPAAGEIPLARRRTAALPGTPILPVTPPRHPAQDDPYDEPIEYRRG
jgi:acyl homoserine lactone synthase